MNWIHAPTKPGIGPWALLVLAATVACAYGPPAPVTVEPGVDACRFCRMLVSNPRVAAQIVTPYEDPLVFDDIGCLRDYLAATATGAGAYAYVADHQTGKWITASRAVYTRAPNVGTPMSSHLIAHADADGRAQDSTAAGGRALTATDVFGPAGVPAGLK
jgi:copper chaperone NosL